MQTKIIFETDQKEFEIISTVFIGEKKYFITYKGKQFWTNGLWINKNITTKP